MPADPAHDERVCWAVSDGRAGMENQALGLAEAVARRMPPELKLRIETRRARLREPWRRLPRRLTPAPWSLAEWDAPARAASPDLWIGCGRQAAALAAALKARAPRAFVVQTQHPRGDLSAFDLIVSPRHDGCVGDNVFPIVGSPNRIERAAIERSAARLLERIPAARAAPRRIAVLVGGPSKAYAFGNEDAQDLAAAIAEAPPDAFVLATTSRRTPATLRDALKAALSERAHEVYSPTDETSEDNPYPALLGAVDAVLVTADSVNMIAEAATAGAPTWILPLRPKGRRAAKFELFQSQMVAGGWADFWRSGGDWTTSGQNPSTSFDETDRAAQEILRRWSPA